MWFKRLTGFEEQSHENVWQNMVLDGEYLTSKINNRRYRCGTLEVPTLERLVEKAPDLDDQKSRIQVNEIVGDVQTLHKDPENVHALFQAASQFNLLEMVGPDITPEQGVDRYERDYTQGPSCAIACGAGTIFRNYFVELNGNKGQTWNKQINCLDLIGESLNNQNLRLWEMTNGYALLNKAGILNINKQLSELSDDGKLQLKNKLKIGVQWNTEVTIASEEQLVSQVYCSALPVAYSHIESYYWENFARLVLEATYEATLYAALINYQNTGCPKVFLTLVGGGAFGNDMDWILDSLELALQKFKATPLEVYVVSYRMSNPELIKMINTI